jgi:hypothetical protein
MQIKDGGYVRGRHCVNLPGAGVFSSWLLVCFPKIIPAEPVFTPNSPNASVPYGFRKQDRDPYTTPNATANVNSSQLNFGSEVALGRIGNLYADYSSAQDLAINANQSRT